MIVVAIVRDRPPNTIHARIPANRGVGNDRAPQPITKILQQILIHERLAISGTAGFGDQDWSAMAEFTIGAADIRSFATPHLWHRLRKEIRP
jgi:hypothetical protein